MSEPFDLDHFLRIPRLTGLRASPDGSWLAVSVAGLDAEGKAFKSAIWGIDPTGTRPPRRLTRSAAGESGAAFLPDGSLLFTSARPDPDAKPDEAKDKPPAGLWLLPAEGGEARLLLAPQAGVAGIATARTSGDVVLAVPLHPGAADFAADEAIEKARKDAGVGALLFERYPIRYWDHYLGPRDVRLFTAATPTSTTETLTDPRDLTGSTQEAMVEPELDLSDDGAFVVATWQRATQPVRQDLIVDRPGDRRAPRADRRRRTVRGARHLARRALGGLHAVLVRDAGSGRSPEPVAHRCRLRKRPPHRRHARPLAGLDHLGAGRRRRLRARR